MSGNPGGGGGPSINRPNPNEDCADLVINTNLASPQANVIENLAEGDTLSIRAITDQGPIQAFDEDGNLAGNIVSREQVRLLTCINGGTSYQAEILSIENAQCRIQIRAI
jgi:hypothetical protein